MTTACDVAAYEQGVWYLRVSAALLLASLTTYASNARRKATEIDKPVAQVVEEMQEAEAVAAPVSVASSEPLPAPAAFQRGARLQVPSVPASAQPQAVRSGRKMRNRRRGVSLGVQRRPSTTLPSTNTLGISAGTSLGKISTTERARLHPHMRNVPARASSSVREPISIHMNPNQVKNLKLSL